MKYSHSPSLYRHICSCHSKKRYTCTCGMIYRRKDNLVIHLRQHKQHTERRAHNTKQVSATRESPIQTQPINKPTTASDNQQNPLYTARKWSTEYSDPQAADQSQVSLQSEEEKKLFQELTDLLRSLESPPEPVINQNGGLDIPPNIRWIVLAHQMLHHVVDCRNL